MKQHLHYHIKMRLHYLQHVEFERPFLVKSWAEEKGIELTRTAFFLDEALPSLAEIDALLILGGPMSVHDEEKYPWLKTEMQFVAAAMRSTKPVLGICLGAQMMARTLGSQVIIMPEKEIGWFDIEWSEAAKKNPLFSDLSKIESVLHWHVEEFETPSESTALAKSNFCKNQAFLYQDNKVGLQFHMEISPKKSKNLIEAMPEELADLSAYVQSPAEIREGPKSYKETRKDFFRFLDKLYLQEKISAIS